MLLNLFQKNSKLILWGIPLITRIRQRNHTHTHTHARTHAQKENCRPMLLNLFRKASKLLVCSITLIPKSDREITHTHTHKENCRPKLLINIEQTKWSGLRHQLLLRACFPVVAQMGLLYLSLDVGRNEAKSSLWLLALFLHLGRSKGHWTDHKAFRGLFEALRICNPKISRPLNLHLFCGGHPQSKGPKPHLFISSSFKSFFNHFSRKEGTANT